MIDVKDLALSDILKKRFIELALNGKDKEEMLSELADLISKSAKLKNKKSLLNALLEREELGSTAIGNGVAIPHAKIDDIKEPILAFGRAHEGVDFNSLDGEKTYLFFVLISPKEEVGRHLKILARISHIIKDKFTVGLFKKAKDADEILKILSTAESRLSR